MSEDETLENIKKEAKRIIEDSVYSKKGHFESAERWRFWNYILMIASIASLCMSLLLTFIDDCKIVFITIGFISGLSTIILIFLNPQEKYLSHYRSGNQFLSLTNKARIFLEIESANMNIEKQIQYLKKLDSRRTRINKYSLPISKYGYKSAKKQIEIDKNTQYQVDKEQK